MFAYHKIPISVRQAFFSKPKQRVPANIMECAYILGLVGGIDCGDRNTNWQPVRLQQLTNILKAAAHIPASKSVAQYPTVGMEASEHGHGFLVVNPRSDPINFWKLGPSLQTSSSNCWVYAGFWGNVPLCGLASHKMSPSPKRVPVDNERPQHPICKLRSKQQYAHRALSCRHWLMMFHLTVWRH